MTFIINRWVRGTDFHGRTQILADIEQRKGKPTWVLGNRRSGKTSLLRQIDWLCRENQWADCTALYWDLQGAGNIEGLKDSFLECLEDAPEVAESLNLDVDDLEDLGFPEIVNKFRRKVKAYKDGYLLLLIDECEELVDISAESPQVLGAFRKLSGHIPHLGLILAGSLRLLDLDESASRTSPLLPDFLPPLLLKPFEQDTTVNLLQQGGLDDTAANAIYELTFGNPHLTQIMGEYWSRLEHRDAVIHELKQNQICQYFFDSNFNCLPADLRDPYKKGNIFATLQALSPNDRLFAYAAQSALVRERADGIEISPLLYLHAEGMLPLQPKLHDPQQIQASVVTAATPAPPKAAPKPEPVATPEPAKPELPWRSTWQRLISFLEERKEHFSVLPAEILSSQDSLDWAEASPPPSLKMMPLLGEEAFNAAKQVEILQLAAPEFVNDEPATEATAVYLAGLYLHRQILGHLPLDHLKDTHELAQALANREAQIEMAQWPNAIDRRAAMVLKRSLKREPTARYQSLQTLEQDVAALLF
jgi:hypothetical protein